MNKDDQRRQQELIAALNKAKEKARITLLYLTVNDRNYEDIANVGLAAEHIEIALGHLGIEI
jgi:DNA-directed RNA polymerase specialized sigma24 family protein